MASNSYVSIVTRDAPLLNINDGPPIVEQVPNSIAPRTRFPTILYSVDRTQAADLFAAAAGEDSGETINNTFFDLKNDNFVFSDVIPETESDNFFVAFEQEMFQRELYTNYYGVTESDTDFISAIGADPGFVSISYDQGELDILENKYATEELIFSLEQNVNFTFDRGEGDTFNSKQVMIEYDSISSLGPITEESITISESTGSVTGLITAQAETIVDVGGLSGGGRNRTLETTNVAASEGDPTRTVETSGY